MNLTKEQKEQAIAKELTDEDIQDWHAGKTNSHINELIVKYGVFQVWGSRTGVEPLTVIAED